MSPSSAAKLASRLTSVARVKNLFLKGVLASYLATFVSLYIQVKVLFGDQGIVPIRDYAPKLAASKNSLDAYHLVLLAPLIKLDYGTFVELLCVLGTLFALVGLFTRRVSTTVSFATLWYIFYSISQVGQGFVTFPSDLLLLEVGFLAIIVASVLPKSKTYQASHDFLSLFLVRWLVFRLFFVSVISVYLDGSDQSWYDLSALQNTLQSAPFPTPLAWHLHNLPTEYLKLIQAFIVSLSITTPFLFFVPLKHVRLFSFWTMFAITALSAATSSFGVYHILLLVSLLSVLRDCYAFDDRKARFSRLRTLFDFLVLFAFVGAISYATIYFFGVKYTNSIITVKNNFTPSQFKVLVKYLVPAAIGVGTLSFVANFYKTLRGPLAKTPLLKSLIYASLCLFIFMASLSTVARYDSTTERILTPITRDAQALASPFKIMNNYAAFVKAHSGSPNGRSELLIQGRTSAEQTTWDLYDTRFKPGYQGRSLAFIVPHLPRMDAKLYYAARSNAGKNPWIQTLLYRIAEREKSVLMALAPTAPMIKPSTQLRVALYTYKFSTKFSLPDSHWAQTRYVSDFLPTTTPENLKFAVKSNGVNLTPTPATKASGKASDPADLLKVYLDLMSDYLRNVDQLLIIWSVFVGSSIVSILRS